MDADPDELAGAVDLFGALTREELCAVFADLAARAGDPFDADALRASVDRAVEDYYLVELADLDAVEEASEAGGAGSGPNESGDESFLVAGPAALPALPAGGEDLPHLLDVGHRDVDPEAVATAALSRLHGDAARAVNDGDDERVESLLDVCYELEAWAPVETETLRGQLDAAR